MSIVCYIPTLEGQADTRNAHLKSIAEDTGSVALMRLQRLTLDGLGL